MDKRAMGFNIETNYIGVLKRVCFDTTYKLNVNDADEKNC